MQGSTTTGETEDIPTYVYIATSNGSLSSFVWVTPSLLAMDWIVKYGVDDLVWFEGRSNERAAEQRAKELRSMTEAERADLVRRHNPGQLDLSPRVWSSDPD